MSVRLAVALLALVAAAAGCGGPPAPERFDDPSAPIEVSAGAPFEIALPGNAGTGYSWKARTDQSVVTYLDSDTEALSDDGRTGGPEMTVLTFMAEGSGTATIEFEYVGPGRDAEVGERRSVEVTVR